MEDVLGSERARMFCAHYGVKSEGNCTLSPRSDPHNEFVGKNVLMEMQSLQTTAAQAGMSEAEVLQRRVSCKQSIILPLK